MPVKRKNEVPKLFFQDPDHTISPAKWLKSILEPVGSTKPEHLAIVILLGSETDNTEVRLLPTETSLSDDTEPNAQPFGNLLNSHCNVLQYSFPDFNFEHAQLPQKTPTIYFKFPPSRVSTFTGSVDCRINWQLYVPVKRGTQVESGFA
jgi:hypothetical protein